ncbi:asparagine synthase-related protein [Novosphingobium sp. PY1]|uniref:asparagine synthase-related protein n=1 Tax=Novosphingobium sp. PY1 TaxID=1882221 RepID=UPI001A8EA3F1|nr:asparagine synthase-related protein [Novosphingobium sp. PY1]GFM28624.1 asparagine synthase [Novosphingobium sp. PY1]
MSGLEFLIAVFREPELLDQWARHIAERTGWQRITIGGPIAIFVSDSCPFIAESTAPTHAVLGSIFARHGPPERCNGLDAKTAQELRTGSLARLLHEYWGAYLAVRQRSDELLFTRDPSAAMPCLYTQTSGGVLMASSIAAMKHASIPRPSVAMNNVADCLFRADLPSPQTALEGIEELAPGTSLVIDANGCRVVPAWSPWDHVMINSAVTFEDHVEQLRRALQNTAVAWASAAGPVLLGVSGGLDSSILATCLRRSTPPALCATLATKDAEGDERHFARKICDHLGMELVEAHYDLADICLDRPARPHMPRPTGRIIAQGYNAAMSRIASEHGVTAFMTGNGGDNVFGFSQSAGAIADRLLHEGLSSAVWRTSKDVCQLTGCSLREAWQATIRILCRPRGYRWRPNRRFLSRDALAQLDATALTHPWLDAPDGALPGKAAHIASLLRIQRHLDGSGQLGDVAVINPLMSQPVLEACLAIPSWMWCRNGQNRSVAREAFRDLMPPSITDRVSKGGPDGFGTQILEHFRETMRERLLDGALASHGIVDRRALEQRLSDAKPNWGADQVRILELLEAEAWIGHWQSH